MFLDDKLENTYKYFYTLNSNYGNNNYNCNTYSNIINTKISSNNKDVIEKAVINLNKFKKIYKFKNTKK
jgi:hypothetical protein